MPRVTQTHMAERGGEGEGERDKIEYSFFWVNSQ